MGANVLVYKSIVKPEERLLHMWDFVFPPVLVVGSCNGLWHGTPTYICHRNMQSVMHVLRLKTIEDSSCMGSSTSVGSSHTLPNPKDAEVGHLLFQDSGSISCSKLGHHLVLKPSPEVVDPISWFISHFSAGTINSRQLTVRLSTKKLGYAILAVKNVSTLAMQYIIDLEMLRGYDVKNMLDVPLA